MQYLCQVPFQILSITLTKNSGIFHFNIKYVTASNKYMKDFDKKPNKKNNKKKNHHISNNKM